MKTLIYSAWTCALMSGMMLLATSLITFAPSAQKSGEILVVITFCSLVFWVALSLFFQWRSKKRPWEPPRSLKIVAFGFAALYLFTFVLFFAA